MEYKRKVVMARLRGELSDPPADWKTAPKAIINAPWDWKPTIPPTVYWIPIGFLIDLEERDAT